jgi:hypothetical protein
MWSKAFVIDRDRNDTADVAHLLWARADQMDWQRLLRRFGPNWRLLLAHFVLFGFVYPSEAEPIPRAVLSELVDRLVREQAGESTAQEQVGSPLGRGTLLSWRQYLVDVNEWSYRDGPLPPSGALTPAQIARWIAAEK